MELPSVLYPMLRNFAQITVAPLGNSIVRPSRQTIGNRMHLDLNLAAKYILGKCELCFGKIEMLISQLSRYLQEWFSSHDLR